jgi:hypothetical protein
MLFTAMGLSAGIGRDLGLKHEGGAYKARQVQDRARHRRAGGTGCELLDGLRGYRFHVVRFRTCPRPRCSAAGCVIVVVTRIPVSNAVRMRVS